MNKAGNKYPTARSGADDEYSVEFGFSETYCFSIELGRYFYILFKKAAKIILIVIAEFISYFFY